MASGALAPSFWFQALDDNGEVLSGALLNFFLTGTSTPATVYHDAALSVPWTQPAICDAAGRIVVYLNPATGNLKLIATDINGVPFGPTVDPVTPTNAGSVGLGEIFVFGSNSASPITGTTYPVGGTLDKLVPGSSPWPVDSATLSGTYKLEVTGVQTTSGTLSVALVNITDVGGTETPIALCQITSLTGQLVDSAPIVFPGGGVVKQYGIKALVSANTGFVIGARIVRTA